VPTVPTVLDVRNRSAASTSAVASLGARNRRRRRLLAVLATSGLLVAPACTGAESDKAGSPRDSASPSAEAPAGSSAPVSPSPTASAPATVAPLVVAAHPSRGRLALTAAQADALAAGTVTDWREVGATPRPLRVGSLQDVRADRDVVAVVPAAAVGPAVSVATVDGVNPLRDPVGYPLTAPGPTPPRVTTVTVTGDIMLGRRVGDRLAAVDDPAAALRPMARRLARADLTVGNLESTLSKAGAPRQGGDSFGASPRVRAGLRLAGYDVLSLANNHTGDYGRQALVETVRRVRAGGFAPVGAGADLARASRPVVVERNGVRFGFVAFDAIGETPAAGPTTPGVLRVRMRPRTGPLVAADLARVTGIVRDLAGQVDVVMVLPHWGTQYTHSTVRDQRVVARALVDAGADLVVGGHPHWVQGMEALQDGLIVHSLGNFVFDMDFSRKTQEGTVLELTFWGADLKEARLVPVVIGPDFAPRPVRGQRADAILDDVWSASGRPLRGTHAP
jgi:poly-gamma-glutamate synthesis protein (capsule biosynthesis protein)